MEKFKTKFQQKKPVLKELQGLKTTKPIIWILIDISKRPMADTTDDYWYTLQLYCGDRQYNTSYPFDSIVVSGEELGEYFEEIQ